MKMIINGKKTDSSDGKTQNIINPATLQVIDTVPSATAEDITRAVDGAVKAQEAWAALPVRERCNVLRKFADLVMERRLELGEILAKEAGKPYMKEAVWELDSVAYIGGHVMWRFITTVQPCRSAQSLAMMMIYR